MDPISVLGIASAIITFIDFSWSLVTGTLEVHRNGRINDDQDIGTIVSDLESIADGLRKRGPGLTRAERSIANLSEQCLATSQELKKLLRPLMDNSQTKRTIWKSLRVQWTIMTGKDKIDELTLKMQGHREQLVLNLSFLLREDQSSLNAQMRAIQDSFSDLNIEMSTKLTSLRDDLIEAVKIETTPQFLPSRGGSETTCFLESLESIKGMITRLQSNIVDMPIQQRILRQLAYAEMESRRYKITEPKAGTLRWMLGQADPIDQNSLTTNDRRQKVRSDAGQNYLRWLREGAGVFHLSGNTGSGKSALMKYLTGHELTKRQLELWAGTKTLVLADFYFWAPGTELQQSLEGMRRTLLFGALSQHSELTERVFPRQWRRMKASSLLADPLVESIQEFGQRQIDDAFSMLAEGRDLSDYKLCFFIDGLDELSGDKQDHEDLAEQICSWTKASNVKFCVSSRPYPEFVEIFQMSGHTTIYLHQLNELDIHAYCQEKFDQDRKGKLLPEKYRQELSREIARKSQGVFLWTFLVVRQLLHAIRNDDPLYMLKNRLDEVPQQLEDLYAKSLKSVSNSKIDQTRAYRILLLALEKPLNHKLDALAYSWIPNFDDLESRSLQDADFPNGIKFGSYSDAEVKRRIRRVIAQVRSLTRDFLEVSPDLENAKFNDDFPYYRSLGRLPVVSFFHRSAHDYLLEDKIQRTSLHDSWPNFAADKICFKICLAEIIINEGSEYYHSQLGEYLRYYYDQPHGVTILRGLQTSVDCRGAYRPFWATCQFFEAGSEKTTPVYDLRSDSFVYVAAYYGLERFVLDEVDLDPSHLRTKNDLNILVSAALDVHRYGKSGLVGELLDRHADLGGMQPVRDAMTDLPEEMRPVWVIVSIALISCLMRHFRASEDVCDLVRVYQYALDQGYNLAMSFKIWREKDHGRSDVFVQSRRVDFGEIVGFCQTLEPELDGGLERRRWAIFLLGTTDGIEDIFRPYIEMSEAVWKP